jgi:hypothetical protein
MTTLKQKNILLLIDFENLFMTAAKQYELLMTEQGVEAVIEMVRGEMQLEDENIFVFAYWDHYKRFKEHFSNTFRSVGEVYESGESCADGYLIVRAIEELATSKDSFDEVVIIGGDSIYSALVRFALRIRKKVRIVAWKISFYEKLKINQSVAVSYLEDMFSLTQKDECIKQGYFTSSVISDAERAIIRRLLTTKFDYLYLTTTANEIISSQELAYKDITEYPDAMNFLKHCEHNGILMIERVTGHRDGEPIQALFLNRENTKVKAISQTLRK